jgi:hypothetical protein
MLFERQKNWQQHRVQLFIITELFQCNESSGQKIATTLDVVPPWNASGMFPLEWNVVVDGGESIMSEFLRRAVHFQSIYTTAYK